jgi:hypothetical protein
MRLTDQAHHSALLAGAKVCPLDTREKCVKASLESTAPRPQSRFALQRCSALLSVRVRVLPRCARSADRNRRRRVPSAGVDRMGDIAAPARERSFCVLDDDRQRAQMRRSGACFAGDSAVVLWLARELARQGWFARVGLRSTMSLSEPLPNTGCRVRNGVPFDRERGSCHE